MEQDGKIKWQIPLYTGMKTKLQAGLQLAAQFYRRKNVPQFNFISQLQPE